MSFLWFILIVYFNLLPFCMLQYFPKKLMSKVKLNKRQQSIFNLFQNCVLKKCMHFLFININQHSLFNPKNHFLFKKYRFQILAFFGSKIETINQKFVKNVRRLARPVGQPNVNKSIHRITKNCDLVGHFM